MNPNQVNRNKNPLLSCAVTGGFQDFTGSGIVLAAAAEKPVFTIGTPAISDSDNFSDVSLDRDGASDTANMLVETPAFYSPLAELDSMGNLQNIQSAPTLDLTQDQQQIDTNLNPISAALAQLPNAASTVFSTFSSIIKGSSSYHKLDEPQHAQGPPLAEPVNPTAYMFTSSFDPNAPPPSFFSPTDDSLFKKQSAEPEINNTFRLGGHKKKTYAHIPGLSSHQQQAPVAQNFNVNPIMPPLPPVIEPVNHYQQEYQAAPAFNPYEAAQPKEPEKTNKFSFTSLLPSQLLEKIPSTKNLFSSNEQAPVYEQQSFNNNQDFSVMTSINDQPSQAANFFNNAQPNQFHGSAQQDQSQIVQQTPVNFFNPMQFNTSPFAQHKASDQISGILPHAQLPVALPSVSMPDFAPPPMMIATPTNPITNQGMFQPNQFSTPNQSAANEPPRIDAISADTNCPPPTFFNPIEASDMFKASQADDGKPKNPYSSSRLSRGVGLYKTRPMNETANTQQMFMPPMPSVQANFVSSTQTSFQPSMDHPNFSQFPPMGQQPSTMARFPPAFDQTSVQQFPPVIEQQTPTPFTPMIEQPNLSQLPQIVQQQVPTQVAPPSDQQKTPSRPPSIPPLPAGGNYGFVQHEPIVPEINSTETFQHAVEQHQPFPPTVEPPTGSLFFNPIQVSEQSSLNGFQRPPSRKKSDLNVPEAEDVSAALNFFDSSPTVQLLENVKPTQLMTNEAPIEATPTFNFVQPKPTAPESFFSNDTEDTISTVHNFFSNEPTIASPASGILSGINSSFPNSTIQAFASETGTDISDKLDSLSMSENIGSTLSLFATSELDSSLAPKAAVPFDSLIPKYLDQQVASTRVTSSPAPLKNYRPVYRHWFYQSLYWQPFAMSDSLALDEAVANGNETVLTDGGRFEVNLNDKRRSSIYWLSGSNAIRRCSWFYKNPSGAETNLIPFDESTAEFMENEYEKAVLNNLWNQRLQLPNADEFLMIKDSANIEYHQMGQTLIVKRGVDEFVIDDGEEASVDHLIILVSNFGDKIDDSADELREKCRETIQHYYSEAFDCGQVGRLEVLPVSLNSVDVLKMKETNSVIEDAPGGNADLMKSSTYQDAIMKSAFYCNQDYYQNIMNHLAFSLNEIVSKFLQRNPEFKGEFSLIATSFEALFLFDLLLNQESAPEFWKLKFSTSNFYTFAMPSNLLTIRNSVKLQTHFELKNCKKFLNVVHRLDPIAQRIEPLIKPALSKLPPESIENETADRTDYTIADGSSLESFSLKNYFTSELIILRITNEIYGALKMDSGSL